MVTHKTGESAEVGVPIGLIERLPLWQFDILELTGTQPRSPRPRGSQPAARYWMAFAPHMKYEQDGVWCERPMGILERLRNEQQQDCTESRPFLKQSSLR